MKRGALLLLLTMVAAAFPVARAQRGPAAPVTSPVTFTNAAPANGLAFTHVSGASPDKYLVETMGSGGLFFDFDDDGSVDVFLVDGGSLADARTAARARDRLFRNTGDGTFVDVTERSGIRRRGYGMGACAADYDNDGAIDLYVTNLGPNTLYHNTRKGTFADVTATAGVGAPGWSTSCTFLDVDRDGDPDLFVTNYVDAGMNRNPFCGDAARAIRVYCHPLNFSPLPNLLYRNNGNGTFTDVSAASGIAGVRGNGLGVVSADYDEDGWPDVFVANDAVPNFLFRNQGNGTFKEVALEAGVSVAADGRPRAGMGTDFGDFDGDGHLDLLVTNHELEMHSLFRYLGKGLFADVSATSGIGPATLPYVGFGTAMFDYDNDGALDIAIVNGHVIDNTAMFRAGSTYRQRKLLFRNTGGRRFVEVSRTAGAGFAADGVGRTLAVGDVDNDGALDLLVTNTGGPAELLRNSGGAGNAIVLRLIGMQSGRDALGARVIVTAGGRSYLREVKAASSYLGQNDSRLHVGLGTAATVDRIEVRWPAGTVENLATTAANREITVREGAGVIRDRPLRRRDRGAPRN